MKVVAGRAAQPSDPFNSLADDATMYFHARPRPHAFYSLAQTY
jgi:hypothetical protein